MGENVVQIKEARKGGSPIVQVHQGLLEIWGRGKEERGPSPGKQSAGGRLREGPRVGRLERAECARRITVYFPVVKPGSWHRTAQGVEHHQRQHRRLEWGKSPEKEQKGVGKDRLCIPGWKASGAN